MSTPPSDGPRQKNKSSIPKKPLDRSSPKKEEAKTSRSSKAKSAKELKNTSAVEKAASNRITDARKQGDTSIDLSGLELVALPSKLYENQASWVNLDISFNRFELWPEFPPLAASITEINLSGNQITSFPPEFSVLSNLEILYLNGNQIMFIPSCISGLSTLTKFHIANNQIASISPEIGRLKKLEDLNLNGNPLQTLPPEIGKLNFLETLDLNACQLLQLPDEFTGLIRLLELDLGNNSLSSLPEQFGNLSRLVSLNLSDNRLTTLPVSMGACQGLDSCQLERNPIDDPELMKKYKIGTDHLRDYLGKKWFAIVQEKKKEARVAEKKAVAAAKQERNQRLSSNSPKISVAGQPVQSQAQTQSPAQVHNLQERENRYRLSSQKLMSDLRKELQLIKRFLDGTSNLQDTITVAKAMRELIPHIEAARKLLPPLPPLKPPNLVGDEDNLTKVKKSTGPRILELESIVDSMIVTITAGATLELLVEMSGFITPCLAALQAVTTTLHLKQ